MKKRRDINRPLVILDAGHGGLIDGVYQTAGKRSPDWENGVLYEGVSNRAFMFQICEILKKNNVPFEIVHGGNDDIPLDKRVKIINKIGFDNPYAYLISIHSNAGGGTGFEFFTSIGETRSDKIATRIDQFFKQSFGNSIAFRNDYSDGDPDKESNFYILSKTVCPAVLLELLFMDNRYDYNLLWDETVRAKISETIAEFIIDKYDKG